MNSCIHENVVYLGKHEPARKGVYIYICNCLDCGSAINLPKKSIFDSTGAIFRNPSNLTQVYNGHHKSIKK